MRHNAAAWPAAGALLAALWLAGAPGRASGDETPPAKGGEAAEEPATEEAEGTTVAILDGAFEITLPAGWKQKEPRSRIVEYEFEVPPAEGDDVGGRVTLMAAGGSVDDNVDRWFGQFSRLAPRPDDAPRAEKLAVGDQEAYLVDIEGTYIDRPAPFADGVEREGYRQLGVIFATERAGNYFVKLYGPAATVGQAREGFVAMIESLRAK